MQNKQLASLKAGRKEAEEALLNFQKMRLFFTKMRKKTWFHGHLDNEGARFPVLSYLLEFFRAKRYW